MNYFSQFWDEDRDDEYASWGTSSWYFETNDSDEVLKQITVYKNCDKVILDVENHFGGNNYDWSVSSENGNIISTGDQSKFEFPVYNQPGVYTYTVTVSNFCGRFTETGYVVLPHCGDDGFGRLVSYPNPANGSINVRLEFSSYEGVPMQTHSDETQGFAATPLPRFPLA